MNRQLLRMVAAVLVPAVLVPALVLEGGLAPLVLSAVVALGVSAPVAIEVAAGRGALVDDAWRRTLTLSLVGTSVTQAPILGSVAQQPLALRAAAATVMLGVGGWWARRVRHHAPASHAPEGAGAGLGLVVAVALAWSVGEPLATGTWSTTALLPSWSTADAWVPGAVTLGLLGGLVGPGVWADAADVRRRPWAVGGASVLAAVLVALSVAGAYGLHGTTPLPPSTGYAATFASLGAAIALTLTLPRPTRALAELLAWVAWSLLAGSGAPLALWALAPLALAAVWAAHARALHGPLQILAGIGTVIAVAAFVLGLPDIPARTGDAVAAAATLVVVVWVAGLRGLPPTEVPA